MNHPKPNRQAIGGDRMNTEDELFKKLRQTPFKELYAILNPSATGSGLSTAVLGYKTSESYMLDILEQLKQHGWTPEEYLPLAEKQKIRNDICGDHYHKAEILKAYPGSRIINARIIFPEDEE